MTKEVLQRNFEIAIKHSNGRIKWSTIRWQLEKLLEARAEATIRALIDDMPPATLLDALEVAKNGESIERSGGHEWVSVTTPPLAKALKEPVEETPKVEQPGDPKTAFDEYFDEQMKDPTFKKEYEKARDIIDSKPPKSKKRKK